MENSGIEMVRDRAMSLPLYKLYRRRFYVLFIFSFLSFNQCLFWITFSPISSSTQEYYDITEGKVDLLLAYGPIFFIPCLPLTYILLNRPNGLRYCVRILAIVGLLSTIIRALPSIVISSSNPRRSSISVPFIHLGQILNAVCGPLAMVPVSQLSSLWFDTNERTRATTVAIMSYNLGSTTGFLMGPGVVYSPSKMPNLLYIHVGLSFVACVLTLSYFPGEPPTPPSPAAQLLMNDRTNEENKTSLLLYFFRILKKCFTNRSFVLLVYGGGLVGGTYGAWTALFDSILTADKYTEKQSGWFGFCSNIAEITGGLVLSFVADMPRFNRSFKIMIIISYIIYFLSLIWFNFSIESIFDDQSIIPSNFVTIVISVTLAGLFQGAASPLMYEALAEFMYPLPESLSAAILVEFINITSLILLFIAPSRSKLMNLIILIIVLVCILLVSLTKFTYKRRDADQIKRNTLVPDDDPLYQPLEDSNIIDPISNAIQMDPLEHPSFPNPLFHQSDA